MTQILDFCRQNEKSMIQWKKALEDIMKNIIIGQSGGPTAVINSSLAGVFSAAKDAKIEKIYGMINGVSL